MANRPRSIFEKLTQPTLPPPSETEKRHVIVEGEDLIGISNREYALEEYDESLWRDMALSNNITNPFTFETDLRGMVMRIPPKPLPEFVE